MHISAVCRVLGNILLLLAGSMFLCYAFGLVEEFGMGKEFSREDGLLLSAGITALVGLIAVYRTRPLQNRWEIQRKEAMAIVGLGWIFAGMFGSLPYLFATPGLGFAGSLFESVSGFTTTGSTVIADLTEYPRSLLLWRALTQWLGGAGILVLFVAILHRSGIGSKSLFRQESTGVDPEGMRGGTRQMATILWLIYLGLSSLCFVGLWILTRDPFAAITHTLTSVSTGGFSPYNESIAYFQNWAVEYWILLFMALGGISFPFLTLCLLRNRERIRVEEETGFYFLLLLMGILILGFDLRWEYGNGFGDTLRATSFQVVSIMTTTGYITADYDQWGTVSRVTLVLLMLVGGCAGSTAGGMKVGRILILLKTTRHEIIRSFRPRQVFSLWLNGNPVSAPLVTQCFFFLNLTGLILAIGTITVAELEQQLSLTESFSAVVATLCNIGPGLGSVGAIGNFSQLGDATWIVLSALMILGRLEFFAILALLCPSLWRKS